MGKSEKQSHPKEEILLDGSIGVEATSGEVQVRAARLSRAAPGPDLREREHDWGCRKVRTSPFLRKEEHWPTCKKSKMTPSTMTILAEHPRQLKAELKLVHL